MKKSLFTFLFLGFLGLIYFPAEATIKEYQFDVRNFRDVRSFTRFVFWLGRNCVLISGKGDNVVPLNVYLFIYVINKLISFNYNFFLKKKKKSQNDVALLI